MCNGFEWIPLCECERDLTRMDLSVCGSWQ